MNVLPGAGCEERSEERSSTTFRGKQGEQTRRQGRNCRRGQNTVSSQGTSVASNTAEVNEDKDRKLHLLGLATKRRPLRPEGGHCQDERVGFRC